MKSLIAAASAAMLVLQSGRMLRLRCRSRTVRVDEDAPFVGRS